MESGVLALDPNSRTRSRRLMITVGVAGVDGGVGRRFCILALGRA